MVLSVLAFVMLAEVALQAAEFKLAVLDIQRTLVAYERRATMRVERERKKKEMQGKLTELEESLKSRQSDLDSMKPGTDSYRQFQLKLIELEAAVEVQRRRFEAEFDLMQRSDMQALYEDVVKELELYAKENAIDLILAKYTGGDARSGPQPVVLFALAGFDITEPIINRLNAKIPAEASGVIAPRTAPSAKEASPRKDALK
jgi:Skp family chaperone for outer membrane proteins